MQGLSTPCICGLVTGQCLPLKGNVLKASMTCGGSSKKSSSSQKVTCLHNHMCALKGLKVKDQTLNLTTTAMDHFVQEIE